MPNDEPQQILTIIWLLTSGGLKLLALGLILAGIGLVLLIRPHRLASTILAFSHVSSSCRRCNHRIFRSV